MRKIFLGLSILTLMTGTGGVAHAAVDYVKICSINGAGYFYDPGTDTCIKADDGTRAKEGVAVNMAMPGTIVDAGKTFGASVHMGTFDGDNAIGVGGAFRAGGSLTFDAGVGVGLSQHTVGGRAGLNVSW